jgi:hypothetical protein
MFHLLCQDKTEIFSLVHTNIVGVRYDSKGLAMNLCVEQECFDSLLDATY